MTRRQITKISREVNRFVNRILKDSGVGSSEYEYIHAVRKNPGINQAGIRALLGLDKGASARRAANLEAKGFLVRRPNPEDGRSQMLFATEKADQLKHTRAMLEADFYEFLLESLPEDGRRAFSETLSKVYEKCKAESKAGFPEITARIKEK